MLVGKRVIVIAGSSGIGAEVATQAATKGAHVTITGRSMDRLEAAASSMQAGVEVAAFDATDRTQVAEFFGIYGEIDHLVSCIGFTERGTLLSHDEDRARMVFDHKLWAQLYIVRQALPHMLPEGSIVLTGGTTAGRAIYPHFSAFSVVANTALGAMVKGLAAEIAPIRINVVEPTLTNTPLVALPAADKEVFFARFIAKSPIARVPQPEDVARSYVHAMESRLINGDSLRPDGGPSFSEW